MFAWEKHLETKKIGKNDFCKQMRPSGLFMKLSETVGLFALEKNDLIGKY